MRTFPLCLTLRFPPTDPHAQHSTFIGRAKLKNKGRISRYLANKCSIASRVDCFSDHATDVFGRMLRDQVDERLKFYDTGAAPRKNTDVMQAAIAEAEAVADAMDVGAADADDEDDDESDGDEPMAATPAAATAALLALPGVAPSAAPRGGSGATAGVAAATPAAGSTGAPLRRAAGGSWRTPANRAPANRATHEHRAEKRCRAPSRGPSQARW